MPLNQNAGLEASSPLASFMEELCRNWLVALLGLPAQAGIGFVSGATMANFTGLAAARHALLSASGWDVESRGLFGAPEVTVVVGEEVHVILVGVRDTDALSIEGEAANNHVA